MKSLLFSLLFCTLFFWACGNTTQQKGKELVKPVKPIQKEQNSKNEDKASTHASSKLTLSLVGNGDELKPGTTLTFTSNGKTETILEPTPCTAIDKEDYNKHEVPVKAQVACTCWWAGGGANYYAFVENRQIKMYKKTMEEGMNEDPIWEAYNGAQ